MKSDGLADKDDKMSKKVRREHITTRYRLFMRVIYDEVTSMHASTRTFDIGGRVLLAWCQ